MLWWARTSTRHWRVTKQLCHGSLWFKWCAPWPGHLFKAAKHELGCIHSSAGVASLLDDYCHVKSKVSVHLWMYCCAWRWLQFCSEVGPVTIQYTRGTRHDNHREVIAWVRTSRGTNIKRGGDPLGGCWNLERGGTSPASSLTLERNGGSLESGWCGILMGRGGCWAATGHGLSPCSMFQLRLIFVLRERFFVYVFIVSILTNLLQK
jgi:hypothetical protein